MTEKTPRPFERTAAKIRTHEFVRALPDDALLTLSEAALLLGVSYYTAKHLVATRQIRSVAIGSRRRIPRAAIREFAKANEIRPRAR